MGKLCEIGSFFICNSKSKKSKTNDEVLKSKAMSYKSGNEICSDKNSQFGGGILERKTSERSTSEGETSVSKSDAEEYFRMENKIEEQKKVIDAYGDEIDRLKSLLKEKKDVHDTRKWNKNWDNRGQGKCSGTRTIFLIRHGQYHQSGAKDADKTLTDLGREQAVYAGKRLKEYGFDYDKIVVSTMARAKETGEIISECLPGVPVKYCNLVREGFPAAPRPPLPGWEVNSKDRNKDDMARLKRAFETYIHRPDTNTKGKATVIVSHDNAIRSMVCRALQIPTELWFRFGGQNCSMTVLNCAANGRVWLRTFGDVGFIPADKVTYGYKNFVRDRTF